MKKTAEEFLKEKGHTINAISCKDDNLTVGHMDIVSLMEEYASQSKWISVEVTPVCSESGDWDGKRSDFCLAIDRHEKQHVVRCYEGILDGREFADWYNEYNFEITTIIHWQPLPKTQ